MHPNEPVSAERLAVALFGEDAPAGAVKTVRVHVSRLRRALGDPDALVTTADGYPARHWSRRSPRCRASRSPRASSSGP